MVIVMVLWMAIGSTFLKWRSMVGVIGFHIEPFRNFSERQSQRRVPCKERDSRMHPQSQSQCMQFHQPPRASYSGKIPSTCRVKEEFKYIFASY